jgi:hypothetical protein
MEKPVDMPPSPAPKFANNNEWDWYGIQEKEVRLIFGYCTGNMFKKN